MCSSDEQKWLHTLDTLRRRTDERLTGILAISSVVWISEWRSKSQPENASVPVDGGAEWVGVAEGPLFLCTRDCPPYHCIIIKGRSQKAGVLSYAISDAWSFAIKPPVNIQLTEHAAAFITNLTFSSQPEGISAFQSVTRALTAIQSKTAGSLRLLASVGVEEGGAGAARAGNAPETELDVLAQLMQPSPAQAPPPPASARDLLSQLLPHAPDRREKAAAPLYQEPPPPVFAQVPQASGAMTMQAQPVRGVPVIQPSQDLLGPLLAAGLGAEAAVPSPVATGAGEPPRGGAQPSPRPPGTSSQAASRQVIRKVMFELLEDDHVIDALGRALYSCGFVHPGAGSLV